MFIKTGDTVILRTGDFNDKFEKGKDGKKTVKTGKVIATSPEEGKVIVQGMNIVSKHQKARKQGEQSQILKVESAVYASKVQLYYPKCEKGVRTHIEVVDGKKIRVCSGKNCGYKFD